MKKLKPIILPSTMLFKSKLEPFRIIGSGLLTVLLIIPSATALFLAFFTDYASHLSRDDQKGIFLFPWFFLVLGLLALYLTIRGRKSIVAYTDSIKIGSQTINYTDIKDIDVLARKSIDWWSPYTEEELIVITTTAEDKLNIHIQNYTNGNVFRALCQQIKENVAKQIYRLDSFVPPSYINVRSIDFSSLTDEHFEVYRSRPFRYMGLLYPPFLWGMGVFLIVGLLQFTLVAAAMGIMFFSGGIYLVYVILSQQNKFLLSNNYLVIKSNVGLHSPVIRLKDIKRVTPRYVSTGRGMPRGDELLIITSDYRLHAFGIPASYKALLPMIEKINAEIRI